MVGAALIALVSRASGLAGVSAPRPRPRPPPPARPPAGAAAAAAGAGGRFSVAASVNSGARSGSVDQRSSSMRSVSAGACGPRTVARRVNAPVSADVVPAPAHTARMTERTATAPAVLLAVIVDGSFGAAEPLDQPLDFRVL